MRELGNYKLGVALMGVIYGTTFKQKWEALTQLFRKEKTEVPISSIKSETITTK